jgi:pimeloyl-ACP methyl ester carboxylesterase
MWLANNASHRCTPTRAGHFLQVGDAKLYYEVYGSGGRPLVLLHGGLYGSIGEFSELIDETSKHRRVIAIAARGHGRSELGKQPFTRALFANDAYAIIRHETSERVDLLGFSDGAITSYVLAAAHPEIIHRLVAIGRLRGWADKTEEALVEAKNFKVTDVARDDPQFVAEREKEMPAPELWDDFVGRLSKMWLEPVYVTPEQIQSIQAPTLIIAGDRDHNNRTDRFVDLYHSLPQAELGLIPGCGHVVLDCNPRLTIEMVVGFLDKPEP